MTEYRRKSWSEGVLILIFGPDSNLTFKLLIHVVCDPLKIVGLVKI